MTASPPASYAFHLAKVSADALRRHARQATELLQSVAKSRELQRTVSVGGECVAGATMLTFAVELYLKSLLLLCRCRVPRTHNLIKLFRALPEKQRQAVTALYDRAAAAHPNAGQVTVGIGQGDQGTPHDDARHDTSLEAVLDRCRDGFENWRYFHEAAQDGGGMAYLTFEYQRLDWICDALDRHIPAGTRCE